MKGGKINKVSTYKELRLRIDVVVQTDVQNISTYISYWNLLGNAIAPTMPFFLSSYDKRNVVQADLD